MAEDVPPIQEEVIIEEESNASDDTRYSDLLARIDALEARLAACEQREWSTTDHTHEPDRAEERAPTATHLWARKLGS